MKSDISPAEIHSTITRLIDRLVTIEDTTGEYLLRLPDGRVIDTKSWNRTTTTLTTTTTTTTNTTSTTTTEVTKAWEWTHGIGLYGIWKYHELTNQPRLLNLLETWFKSHLDDAVVSGHSGTTKNINTMCVFLTLAHLYEATGNRAYVPWLESWAEWALHELPRTPYGGMQHVTYVDGHQGQLWDDTLMMTVLPLAKIGVALKRRRYVEEAKRQFLLHIRYLGDVATGLFFHGWEFHDPEAEGNNHGISVGHNFARARWARGNSWITIAIPEMLELLETAPRELGGIPPDDGEHDAFRLYLIDTLSAQCRALARLQDPESGMWRTLLDVPAREGSYPEASATAGFAYGILKARRKRYLPKHPNGNTSSSSSSSRSYDEIAAAAIRAILSNVTPDGELRNVSFGTAMGSTLQFYKEIPLTSMPYGQAMAVMALGEYARVFY
ncbi:family 88 putative glycosyl hydrolase [Thermoascus aurantiacus ATCC 26904]